MTTSTPPQRIAVGLSGGVDSSLAAALLLEQGHEVFGITMQIWDGAIRIQEAQGHACFGPDEEQDIADSAEVCRQLGIAHHVFDLSAEYAATVLDYFRGEYLTGRTPNPCVVCNHRLKFGFLIDAARRSGLAFDRFATGHYARLESRGDRLVLLKGVDPKKDQSYFLNALPRTQLPELCFPLGGFDKARTREEARRLGLAVAEREESQDFISGGDYAPLFAPEQIVPGDIVNEQGEVLGRHQGIVHYTVGQRKGLGIAAPKPLYVLRLDARANRVVVTDREGLFAEGLEASHLNLLGVDHLEPGLAVTAKVRQGPREVAATVQAVDMDRFRLHFQEPVLSVAPGQYAVLYQGDLVLGGGIIERALGATEL